MIRRRMVEPVAKPGILPVARSSGAPIRQNLISRCLQRNLRMGRYLNFHTEKPSKRGETLCHWTIL